MWLWKRLVTEDNTMRVFGIEVAKQGGINSNVLVRTKKGVQHPVAFLAKGGQNQSPRKQRQQLGSGNKAHERVVFDLSACRLQSVLSQGCIKLLN